MTTKRKLYVREVPANWWTKSGYYRHYMIRELSSIPILWFSCLLIYILFVSKENSDLSVTLAFLRHPIMLFINAVALIGALLHSVTWFKLTPKAINIVNKNAEKIAPVVFVRLMWGISIIATIIILTYTLIS